MVTTSGAGASADAGSVAVAGADVGAGAVVAGVCAEVGASGASVDAVIVTGPAEATSSPPTAGSGAGVAGDAVVFSGGPAVAIAVAVAVSTDIAAAAGAAAGADVTPTTPESAEASPAFGLDLDQKPIFRSVTFSLPLGGT